MAQELTHCDCGCIYENAACPNCNSMDPVELKAKLVKAVKAAFTEGFLAGTADGWVNNPRIKMEWQRSEARAVLAKLEN